MSAETIGRIVVVLGLTIRTIVLRPRDAALMVRMALWIVVISILARLTSLPRVQQVAMFGVRPSPGGSSGEIPARLARAIDSVQGTGLFVFQPSCWKRALVLQRFLGLSGIQSRVNFGVKKAVDQTVSGHAWLEHQGRPLLENHAGASVTFFSLPRHAGEAAGRQSR